MAAAVLHLSNTEVIQRKVRGSGGETDFDASINPFIFTRCTLHKSFFLLYEISKDGTMVSVHYALSLFIHLGL